MRKMMNSSLGGLNVRSLWVLFCRSMISKVEFVHLKTFKMFVIHLLGHTKVYAYVLHVANFMKIRIFIILCNEIGMTIEIVFTTQKYRGYLAG